MTGHGMWGDVEALFIDVLTAIGNSENDPTANLDVGTSPR